MKKSWNKALSLLMILAMALGFTTGAAATDASITFQGKDDGFRFQPGSDYTATDLFGNFKNVMPGDTRTETVTFTNADKDSDYVVLYMKALPHGAENPISEAVETELEPMEAFLSQLTLTVTNGGQVIYESSPEKPAQLTDFVQLGTFRTGETAKLQVSLTVPLELGNDYANQIGEVDWVFHVEAFQERQITVRKVWSDGNENHTDDSIDVNLLRDGQVVDTKTLSAENSWTYTFDKLVEGQAENGELTEYSWKVEEAKVPQGYTATYDTQGNVTTITNTKNTVDVSVEKQWVTKGQAQPDSVEVQLYNGQTLTDTVTLQAANQWQHTWKGLDESGSWSVRETQVPAGYTVSYDQQDHHTVITNTFTKDPHPATTELTVRKVWSDGAEAHKNDSVTVNLLKDGKVEAQVKLDSTNNWTHTWDKLDPEVAWNAEEAQVPQGYTVSYQRNGTELTITNTKKAAPVDRTVKKLWTNDKSASRPGSVTVTLYNGNTAVETVKLDGTNNWSYTWKNLDGDGNWQILETSVPKGYTPSYTAKDGVVTITNTAALIQTGQMNWPIPVLAAAGVILLALGGVLVAKKKKHV